MDEAIKDEALPGQEAAFFKAQEPFGLFADWFAEAEQTEPVDANAMALATVSDEGWPNVRIVLLKGFDERGFAFYTNYESAKGTELLAVPRASLNFYWKSRDRQVRVAGPVEQVSEAEADAYFASRARGSRIGAWASDQSRPVASRAELEAAVARANERFDDKDVPRPPHWSGFRVVPLRIEFWQAGEFRLHDRLVFSRDRPGADAWHKERLNP
ncbi:MAG: pyridoxamine 5'-phosphate oxidase [Pseudomonadota bacterium]